MSGFFYDLGRQFGRKAVPAIRKSKWIWDGLTGSEEEALRAEMALGKDMAAELLAVSQTVNDPAVVGLVDDVCLRLGACVKNKARSFRCDVIHDESVNAMALPGGLIVISDSLIALSDRQPDELAFVIGHEMGHIIRRHTWDRMINEAVLRVASTVAARAGALGAWVRQKGVVLLRTAYSRDAEREADEFGFRLATAAGFAPEAAVHLLQCFGRFAQKSAEPGPYLLSHPPPSERIAFLRRIMRQHQAPHPATHHRPSGEGSGTVAGGK